MICDLYLPFSIVSHPSFKRFVHRFDTSYEIPDRHTISHSLVPNLSKKMMENLIDCIEGCLFAAMTADGWKSRMRHKYLNVNIHFIDAHWIFRSACIGVDELTDETAAGSDGDYPIFFGNRLPDYFLSSGNRLPITF